MSQTRRLIIIEGTVLPPFDNGRATFLSVDDDTRCKLEQMLSKVELYEYGNAIATRIVDNQYLNKIVGKRYRIVVRVSDILFALRCEEI